MKKIKMDNKTKMENEAKVINDKYKTLRVKVAGQIKRANDVISSYSKPGRQSANLPDMKKEEGTLAAHKTHKARLIEELILNYGNNIKELQIIKKKYEDEVDCTYITRSINYFNHSKNTIKQGLDIYVSHNASGNTQSSASTEPEYSGNIHADSAMKAAFENTKRFSAAQKALQIAEKTKTK